tara:strand:+ start:669 stop:950 length:282 start_codon:yes stop_codon:yes gene_type:complete
MYKLLKGQKIKLTADEISAKQAEETAWNNGAFDRALEGVREKRNSLLAETDFYALSDVTMSPEMDTYRQELRDITNGITTVEEANAVVFPTKP